MKEIDIINKFSNGEFKGGETFVYNINNSERIRLQKVMLSVDKNGSCLTCSWLDYKDNIICNQWSLWKDNLIDGEYIKI